MKIFIDSTDIDHVTKLASTGLIDGITTNPSLMAKSKLGFMETLKALSKLTDGSVSAEVTAVEYNGMMAEAEVLRKVADNITVKLPLTVDGLRACRDITNDGGTVNVTLCFSATQALLAAKAGATYISPFLGRLDDLGTDGLQMLKDIRDIYDQYPDFDTQILGASIRHPVHVLEAAKMGVDIVTIPPKIFEMLYVHPLTTSGIESFLQDWSKTGYSIL